MKLNLGSGKSRLDGFKNVDFRAGEHIDIVHDVRKPLPVDDNSVDHIFASHIIEHIWWFKVEEVLKDWYRTLKPGAILDIWTVDWDILIYHFVHCTPENFQKTMDSINWRLFSKEDYEGHPHHSMFNYQYLGNILVKVGFKKVQKIDAKTYPFYPLHEDINLGIRATK